MELPDGLPPGGARLGSDAFASAHAVQGLDRRDGCRTPFAPTGGLRVYRKESTMKRVTMLIAAVTIALPGFVAAQDGQNLIPF